MCKLAKEYELKGYTVVIEGNYIYRNIKSLYGNEAFYFHLDGRFSTIYRRHKNREKKPPLRMIFSSWLLNKLRFRNSVFTDALSAEEVAEIIMRGL